MHLRPLAVFISSLLAVASAAAAAAAPATSDVVVVTATRTSHLKSDLGQSISVIDIDTLATLQTIALSDALVLTPGVSVSRNGDIGGLTTVRIRGAEGDHTTVLIDGVKLNDPSSTGGATNFADLLAGNIARVEILRGPQSVLWGSQSIGGVVNIITIEPEDELRANGRVEYGSRDSAQVVANVSGRSGRLGISGGGAWFTTDGVSQFARQYGGTERDGYRNRSANLRVTADIAEHMELDLRGWYADGRTDIDGFPPPDYSFADTREQTRTRELVGYAGLRFDLFDGRFNNILNYTYTDTDRAITDPDANPGLTFDAAGSNERVLWQGSVEVSDGIELVLGAESETSRMRAAAPAPWDPEPVPLRASATMTSGFAQVVARVNNSVTLTGGLRHDDHDEFGGATTFGASASWQLNDAGTRLKANYGEGFKAPTLYQLYSEYGNINLVPERATGMDVGIEQSLLDGRVTMEAALYRRTTRNMIDFDVCFPAVANYCTNRPFGAYANLARTTANGFEFALAARPTDRLSLSAQYTYTDARNRARDSFNFDNQLARRARHTAAVNADYTFNDAYAVGLTMTYSGRRFDDAGNTTGLASYVLVDLRASHRLTDNFEVYARVNNLFDEAYETTYRYGAAGRAAFAGLRLSY
ncbi:MAG: TonB-dependent receptor [Gammaproteobacteria bacterium]|nr:TonB-dependent receptor [Gammaproteobacteria bacterium]